MTPDSKFKWTPASFGRNKLANAYEPLQPYVFSELSKAAGCRNFVDVGANIGFYTVFMADEISADECYSFEAMPAAFEQARQNIELNDMQDAVSLRQVAISAEKGTVEMAVISELSGANAVLDTAFIEGAENLDRLSIPSSTLDLELPSFGKPVAVKIDVEGHEPDVLLGGADFLTSSEAVIQIESYESGADTSAAILEGYGYRRLIAVGPDVYYTNIDREFDVTGPMERAMARFVEASKQPDDNRSGVLRKRILMGVTLELSPRLAKMFRRQCRG